MVLNLEILRSYLKSIPNCDSDLFREPDEVYPNITAGLLRQLL
jgi:hypothetical protein